MDAGSRLQYLEIDLDNHKHILHILQHPHLTRHRDNTQRNHPIHRLAHHILPIRKRLPTGNNRKHPHITDNRNMVRHHHKEPIRAMGNSRLQAMDSHQVAMTVPHHTSRLQLMDMFVLLAT
jgi:hypothetical protein